MPTKCTFVSGVCNLAGNAGNGIKSVVGCTSTAAEVAMACIAIGMGP